MASDRWTVAELIEQTTEYTQPKQRPKSDWEAFLDTLSDDDQ